MGHQGQPVGSTQARVCRAIGDEKRDCGRKPSAASAILRLIDRDLAPRIAPMAGKQNGAAGVDSPRLADG